MRPVRLRLRWVGPVAVLGLVAGAAPASAGDVAISATVLSGSRTLTSAALTTPLGSVVRTLNVTSTLNALVTETAVSGDATGWSVTVRLCGPNNTTTPTASDCATYGDKLVESGGGSNIAGTNVTLSGASVTPVVTSLPSAGGTTTALNGTADLSTTRTLISNTGQSAGSVYTGMYAATATVSFTPPASANAAVYNGYLVVTLLQ